MPRIVDHAERRREIVLALWAVIHEKGIDGITFAAVAAEAEVSIGRIQHYFDSKQSLVRFGAEAIVAAAEDMYREHTESADPRAVLVALLTQPVPTGDASRAGVAVWYAYLSRATSDPWIRAFLVETAHGTLGETERWLRNAGVDDDEVPAAAQRLVAVSYGATQSVLIGAMSPDAAMDMVTAEIYRALTSQQRDALDPR